MLIQKDLTKEQYKDLQNTLRLTDNISIELFKDIQNENLQSRLTRLVPQKYLKDDIDYYNIQDNIISSWINLMREWFCIGIRKDITTYFYWARIKHHPKYIKIGITYDINNRSNFENNKYYDYHCIRWCSNRYACAYLEYKVRTLFCNRNSETIELCKLNTVIDYVKNFHYSKTMREELQVLGWKFKEIK